MIQGAAEEILCRGNDLWCNWCHKSYSYFCYFFFSHKLFQKHLGSLRSSFILECYFV